MAHRIDGVKARNKSEETICYVQTSSKGTILRLVCVISEREGDHASCNHKGASDVKEPITTEFYEIVHDRNIGTSDEDADASIIHLSPQQMDVFPINCAVKMEQCREQEAADNTEDIHDKGPDGDIMCV